MIWGDPGLLCDMNLRKAVARDTHSHDAHKRIALLQTLCVEIFGRNGDLVADRNDRGPRVQHRLMSLGQRQPLYRITHYVQLWVGNGLHISLPMPKCTATLSNDQM
jgi:hypothetical protein